MDQRFFSMLWVFGIFILFMVANYISSREKERQRERRHKERMLAMEKGIPLPELPPPQDNGHQKLSDMNPRWPLGFGVMMTMLSIGGLAGMLISTTAIQPYWTLNLIPMFLGLGSILYYYLIRPRSY